MKKLTFIIFATAFMLSPLQSKAAEPSVDKHSEAYIRQRIDTIYKGVGDSTYDPIYRDSAYCSQRYYALMEEATQLCNETGEILYRRMKVSTEVTDFAIPLCATIHMSGSCMKITACAVALMLMQGMTFTTPMFVGFVMMLGVMMVASPGVPGGAIMASLGVLSSLLGFGEQDCALMIALYIAMDSFGTACNVTGDGAISLIVDRVHHGSKVLSTNST